MIITQPQLQKEKSAKAFELYMEKYNTDRPLGERLRGNHLGIMRLLFHFLKERLDLSLSIAKASGNPSFMKMDISEPIKITTNNKVIARKRKLSPRTIQRLIDRLEQANAIIKVFHGRERNYSIIFNPFLLEIIDKVNIVKSWKSLPERAFDIPKRTNCPPNHVGYRNIFNNIIIHKSGSIKIEKLQMETFGNKNGNTRKCANKFVEPTPENPLGINIPAEILQEWKQNVAVNTPPPNKCNQEPTFENTNNSINLDPGKTRLKIIKTNLDIQQTNKVLTAKERLKKIESDIRKMRKSYALLMVQLMIQYLAPKSFKIHNSYFIEVVDYVEDHYFGNISTFIGIERAWVGYSARLEDAKRFKQNNPNYTPFPRPFFDKNNTKGFDNPQWYKNKRKWERQKRYQTDQKRLMKAIRNFNAKPTNSVYQQQIETLRNTVQSESTFKAFFKIVASGNGGQLPKFNT